MLSVTQVSCSRDERTLFHQLSFTVQSGDMLQVEGPNGAGKTTLLRMLAGLSLPDEGEICWQDVALHRQRELFHQQMLYLGHHPGVKSVLTPFENLAFYQSVQGSNDHEAIWDALAQVDLVGYEDVPAAQLSAGQHRRVALARLWLTRAPLWILDEPLTAIDKSGVAKLVALFHRHTDNGGMIILTTHQDLDNHAGKLRKLRLRGEGAVVC